MTGPITRPAADGEYLAVHQTVAEELAAAIRIIEDWLLHTGDEVLTDLADFAFRTTGNPTIAVARLIDQLGEHNLRLSRLLRAADRPT